MSLYQMHGSSQIDAFDLTIGWPAYSLRTYGGDDLIVDHTTTDSFIFAGTGADSIFDYAGDDTIHAGKGNDQVYVDATGDARHVVVYGGKGHDVLVVDVGTSFEVTHDRHGTEYVTAENGSTVEYHGFETVHFSRPDIIL